MTSKQSLSVFTIILYSFLFFSLSTFFYYVSVNMGFKGLGVPLFGGGDDGVFYYEQAKNVASDQPAVLTSIHAIVLGWIFKIFQTDEVFLLRAFNFIGNFFTLLVGLKIISILQGGKKNLVASLIFVVLLAYYPSYVINSNLSIYRDTWIIFYYELSLLFFINFVRYKSIHYKLFNFSLMSLSLVMLFNYRGYAMLAFVISSGIYLILFYFAKKIKRVPQKMIVIVLVGFTIFYTLLQSFKFPLVNLSLSDVLNYRMGAINAGGSQMNISLDQSNVIFFYFNYFYSVISNAIGPFPWQFTGVSSIIIFLSESLLFIFIIWKLYENKKLIGKLETLIIVHSVIWFMLIGISNDNIGTAARLRMVGWVMLFIVFVKIYTERLLIRKNLKKRVE